MANKISVIIDVVADKASASLKNFKSDLANAEGSLGKMKVAGSAAFDQIKANAAGMAVAAGTALVAFGVKAVGAFNDLALAADRFSDTTGIAVEDASRWIEVGGDVGVGAEAIQGAFQKMNKAIADGKLDDFASDIVRAKDGTVDANATFQNLVTTIGAIKDPTERALAAQKAFGKGYSEIAELMEMSATDLKGALDGVSDAKVIDEGEVEKAKKFRAALDELRDKTEDLALQLGESLVPAASAAVDTLSGVMEVADELGDKFNVLFGESSILGKIFRENNDLYELTTAELIKLEGWTGKSAMAMGEQSFEARLAKSTMNDLGEEVERTTRSYEELKSSVDILKGALSDRDAFDEAIQAQNELIWAQAEAAKGGENQAAAQEAVKEATRRSIDATVNYIDTLGGIPPSKATAIAAMIDEGSFDAVEQQLRILARNRQVDVQIVARGGAGYGVGARASGGPVSAGMPYIVGEQGPELVVPSSNGTVIPNNRLGSVSGGSSMNITINMPPGSNGQDVVNAIRKYERTNGTAWRS